MARLVARDSTGELKQIAKELLADKKYKEEFRILRRALKKKKVKIIYLWRLGKIPRFDEENRPLSGVTRRLPNSLRDIFGVDFTIEIFRKNWRELHKKSKYRTIYHELLHCQVEETENFKLAKDSDGRIEITCRPHSTVVLTFSEEIERFGLSPGDVPDAITLSKALKKRKKEK